MTNDIETIDELNRLIASFEKQLSNNQAYIGLTHAKGLLNVLSNSNQGYARADLQSFPVVAGTSYNPEASQIQKAEFVLKEADKPLTTAEIVNRIIELEPSKDKRKTAASLSAVLGDYCKRNKVVTRRVNENKELIYSLLEWPHDPKYY